MKYRISLLGRQGLCKAKLRQPQGDVIYQATAPIPFMAGFHAAAGCMALTA